MGFIANILTKAADVANRRAPLNAPSSIFSQDNGVPLPLNWRVLYSEYRKHADVFACVREIADGVGGNGWHWENVNDPEGEPNEASIVKAEQVLEGFLPGQTPRSIIRNTVKHFSIGGNSFWALNKNEAGTEVLETQLLTAKYMAVMVQNDQVVGYVYTRPGKESVIYDLDEIIHFAPDTDTDNEVWGMSPLETLVWEVRTDLGAMWANYMIFTQGQRAVHYILSSKLTADQRKKAAEKIKKQVSGARNRHKALIMSGVEEVKPLDVSPKDMEFSVLRRMTTEKISAAFGVPKSIIGYRDSANEATASKSDRRNFHENTIRPIEQYIEDKINRELLPALGIDDVRFVFNATSFEEIADNEERAIKLRKNGMITTNEARTMIGHDPVDPELSPMADELVITEGTPVPLSTAGANADGEELVKAVSELEKAVWNLPQPHDS